MKTVIYSLFLSGCICLLASCAVIELPVKTLDTVGGVVKTTGKVAEVVGKTVETTGQVAVTVIKNPSAAKEALTK